MDWQSGLEGQKLLPKTSLGKRRAELPDQSYMDTVDSFSSLVFLSSVGVLDGSPAC